MWRSVVGQNIAKNVDSRSDDEWDSDPNFVNDITEKEQRWGSKAIEGSGRLESINIQELRQNVVKDNESIRQKEYEEGRFKFSFGYGGKYGVQTDRVDKSALRFDSVEQNEGNKIDKSGEKNEAQIETKNESAAKEDLKPEETTTKVENNKPGKLKINSIFLQNSSTVQKPSGFKK